MTALQCLHDAVFRVCCLLVRKPPIGALLMCSYVCVNVLPADFGLAKEGVVHDHKGTGRFCDTAEYVAPEIINGTGYGTGVNWWALGMVLYEMLTGMMIYVWIAYPCILHMMSILTHSLTHSLTRSLVCIPANHSTHSLTHTHSHLHTHSLTF